MVFGRHTAFPPMTLQNVPVAGPHGAVSQGFGAPGGGTHVARPSTTRQTDPGIGHFKSTRAQRLLPVRSMGTHTASPPITSQEVPVRHVVAAQGLVKPISNN